MKSHTEFVTPMFNLKWIPKVGEEVYCKIPERFNHTNESIKVKVIKRGLFYKVQKEDGTLVNVEFKCLERIRIETK